MTPNGPPPPGPPTRARYSVLALLCLLATVFAIVWSVLTGMAIFLR